MVPAHLHCTTCRQMPTLPPSCTYLCYHLVTCSYSPPRRARTSHHTLPPTPVSHGVPQHASTYLPHFSFAPFLPTTPPKQLCLLHTCAFTPRVPLQDLPLLCYATFCMLWLWFPGTWVNIMSGQWQLGQVLKTKTRQDGHDGDGWKEEELDNTLPLYGCHYII